MKFGIISNPELYTISDALVAIIDWAQKNHCEVILARCLEKKLEPKINSEYILFVTSENDVVKQSDYIISLGGDGTMLWTARTVLDLGKPILGINSGRLGFLANTNISDISTALDKVKRGQFALDKRKMIHATLKNGEEFFALNEVLFTKRDTVSMIFVEVGTETSKINKYWADGLLVSTPTGSTAYNLSAGGPIIDPSTDVFVITPVSPHTLSARPVVVPASNKIWVKVPEQNKEIMFSVDGRSHTIEEYPFDISIKQSDFTINLIRLEGHDFFETLRNKLLWGRDYREN